MESPTDGHRPREILVIHPGALGDVLQAVPALRALRRLGGGSRLTFAGQRRLGALLAGAAAVAEALAFDALGLETLFAGDAVPPEVRARLGRFDRVISWFGARAAPYPERLRALVPTALAAPPVPEGEGTGPVWRHLLGTLAPWGLRGTPRPAPLTLPAAWDEEARRLLARLGAAPDRALLVVHPGAGAAWKRWAPERFAEVIRRARRERDFEVVVHQGPADADAAAGLAACLAPAPPRLLEPPLPLLAGVLGAATAYVGADSGVSHLAAAVGARAVVLFPAATRDRWAPWSPTALALQAGAGAGEIERVASAVLERLAPASDRAAERPAAAPGP